MSVFEWHAKYFCLLPYLIGNKRNETKQGKSITPQPQPKYGIMYIFNLDKTGAQRSDK